MLIMGVGYCTLHSSCGTFLAKKQDTRYPSEGISLYKCYLGRAFQFLEVLTALWRSTGPNQSTHDHQPGFCRALEGRRERLCVSPSVCTLKCTYDIRLHLVVMVAGPAASRMPSSFTDSNIDNRGGGGGGGLFLLRVLIPRTLKRFGSNFTREDSQTASARKCWCSELYKQDGLSVLS